LVKEGSGVAANVLKNLDIDLRKIRTEVEKIVQPGSGEMVSMGKLPHTPRAKKVIEYSIEEARNLNHNYVGTEHLLLGLLREQEGVLGEMVKHTKRGGASAMPGRRGGTAGQTQYEDELVERNMKEAVEFAVHFFEENHVRRVLIGGTDDNVARFRSLLPKAWQSLVKGTFAIGMTASHAEVLARTMQIGNEAERQREASLVENLITTALKKGNATIGVEDTLKAVSEGRAQTLVVSEGFHLAGYRCTGCYNLTLSGASNHCTVCGAKLEAVPDVIELAVGEAMRRGGEVEVMHANPLFEKHGSIGAYLRY
jgi:peptide subunit release factor 1 (eRF1)